MPTVELIKDKFIAHIVLNRPEKLNAINVQSWFDIKEVTKELADDDSIRCAILCGKGRAFSSGLDLSPENELFALVAGAPNKSELLQKFRKLVSEFELIFANFEALPFPIIAACHGYVFGVGLELALCADFIYASSETQFSIPEVELGLIPDMGGNQRLARFVGVARAKELIYSGDRISAEEAYKIGLVNKLFPNPDVLFEEAKKMAQRIAKNAPLAVKACKRSINFCYSPKREQMAYNSELAAQCLASDDLIEAFRAKLEKREAEFKGG